MQPALIADCTESSRKRKSHISFANEDTGVQGRKGGGGCFNRKHS